MKRKFLTMGSRGHAILAAALLLLLAMAGCNSKKSAVGNAYKPTPSLPSRIAASAEKGELPDATRRLLAEADTWLGTPYRYGGAERGRGADCSGFVMAAFSNALALSLPRSSREQEEWCAPVKGGVKKAVPGDLVFFAPGSNGKVSHVGIYLGDGKVVHASSSKGVIVSDLAEDYYAKAYHSTGRVESYYAMLDGHGGAKPAPAPARRPAPSPKEISLDELAAVSATPDKSDQSDQSDKSDLSDRSDKAARPPRRTALAVASETPDTTITPDEARRRLLLRLAETDSVK